MRASGTEKGNMEWNGHLEHPEIVLASIIFLTPCNVRAEGSHKKR